MSGVAPAEGAAGNKQLSLLNIVRIMFFYLISLIKNQTHAVSGAAAAKAFAVALSIKRELAQGGNKPLSSEHPQVREGTSGLIWCRFSIVSDVM